MVLFTEQMFSQRLKALSNKKFSFGAGTPNVSQAGKNCFISDKIVLGVT